jgi:uncharacterized protein YbjT (DUF2867 family)
MTTSHDIRTILVLGGTGKTGRRLVERLRAHGTPVRVGSRAGTPPFDWENPETWEPALRGIDAVYVSFQPDLAVPGAVDTVRSFADLAVARGVRRLVLLSGRGEEEAERAERAITASGADWTILRATWFAQNFSEGAFLDAVLGGEVALPAGDIGEPFVDVDDIADVAFAALTDRSHVGRLYELTGPRPLTFAEATAEIAEASGRQLSFRYVPPDRYAAQLGQQGVPADIVSLLTYLFTTVLDGRNARPAGGVRDALGRAPRDFAAYARQAAASGVWRPA